MKECRINILMERLKDQGDENWELTNSGINIKNKNQKTCKSVIKYLSRSKLKD